MSRFLIARAVLWFVVVGIALTLLGILIDFAPVSKKAIELGGNTAFAIQLSLLRIPRILQEFLPFIVLFGTILALIQSTQSHELIALRAFGVSAWQFLQPFILVTGVLSLLTIIVLDPLGTAAARRYNQLTSQDKTTLSRKAVAQNAPSGLWLRETGAQNSIILQAPQLIDSTPMQLLQPFMLVYDRAGQFIMRVDATLARLISTQQETHWRFEDAMITTSDSIRVKQDIFEWRTQTSRKDLYTRFLEARTIPIWKLPAQIRAARDAGLQMGDYLIRLYELLALPVFLLAMMLIGAAYSLPRGRLTPPSAIIFWGFLTGFGFFAVEQFVSKLSKLEILPHLAAAWVPSIIGVLLATALLVTLEDG